MNQGSILKAALMGGILAGVVSSIPLLSMLMGGPFSSFNLLPILLGISQLLQTKFMPRGNTTQKSASSNPDQMEQQRKMMQFMSRAPTMPETNTIMQILMKVARSRPSRSTSRSVSQRETRVPAQIMAA